MILLIIRRITDLETDLGSFSSTTTNFLILVFVVGLDDDVTLLLELEEVVTPFLGLSKKKNLIIEFNNKLI